MGDGMGSASCKISMLWNWYTIDACFLSSSWHVTTKGTFAVSCIGVMLMVVCLEALRRLSVELDKSLSRQLVQRYRLLQDPRKDSSANDAATLESISSPREILLRITPLQQLVRAVLHAVTFGLAYLIMLLAMYFNGYIIISIILGAGIGKFFCDWKSAAFAINLASPDHHSVTGLDQSTLAQRKLASLQKEDAEAQAGSSHTVCCE